MSTEQRWPLRVAGGVPHDLVLYRSGDHVALHIEIPPSETHVGNLHGYQERTSRAIIEIPAEHRQAVALALDPASDTLEKAAMEVVEAWGHIRCDSRNDAPWRQLRDWEGFDAVMAALMALVEDKMRAEAFAEDGQE